MRDYSGVSFIVSELETQVDSAEDISGETGLQKRRRNANATETLGRRIDEGRGRNPPVGYVADAEEELRRQRSRTEGISG